MAAPGVDWRLASEIDPFPRVVLQDRFGYVPREDHNQGDPLLWGDMTTLDLDAVQARGVPLPDLVVAGTPCQAFSVAGMRKGLKDSRGNLTLKFVETCHAIVDARPDGKLKVLWENVPGVLSDKGNAFGAFLGGLVGAMDSLLPEPCPAKGKSTTFWKWHKGGKLEVKDDNGEPTGEFIVVEPHHRVTWPSEGMVQGPRARLAWSVLDAQWFGVAQRRRRVFVVVDFGGACDPAQILLEPDSLRGNPPARGEAGQGIAADARSSASGSHWDGTECHLALNQSHNTGGIGASNQEIFSQRGAGLVQQTVGALTDGAHNGGGLNGQDAYSGRIIPVAFDCKGTEVQTDASGGETPLRSMGQNAGGHAAVAFAQNQRGELRTSCVSPQLTCGGGKPGEGYPAVAFDLRGRDGGAQVESVGETVSLRAADGGSSRSYVADTWAVRRLTPPECHRLQGFPDDHCAITYRNKPAADGPQYKALGNSMAVPCVQWILERMI